MSKTESVLRYRNCFVGRQPKLAKNFALLGAVGRIGTMLYAIEQNSFSDIPQLM